MLEFLLANLPIVICFIVGVGLLVLEVFLPGFGVPGITGIALEIAAIVLIYLGHGPLAALGMTILVLAIIALAISFSLRSVTKGRLSKSPIILNDTESNADGYSANEDMDVFLGKEGVAITTLRPAGMAEFDGVKLNVVADGEYIPKDTPVRVDHVEGSRIVVRRFKQNA